MRALAPSIAPLTVACSLALAPASCSSPAPAPAVAPVASIAPAARAVASAPAAASAAAPAPAACFPKELRGAEIHSSTLEGDRLTVCLEHADDQTHPCLALDLRTRRVERTAAARGDERAPTRAPVQSRRGDERSFPVCSRPGRRPQKRCDVIRPTGRLVAAGHGDSDEKRGILAAYSPDGSTIAAILPERSAKGDLTVDVATYSTRSLAQLTRRRVPSGDEAAAVFRDPTDVWSLAWLDDQHLRLSAHRCCGPDGSEALLDLRKGTFEALGDPTFLERVQGGLWLRGDSVRGADEAGGLALTFLHLDTGARSTLKLPGGPSTEPEGRDLAPHRWSPSWVVAHTNPPGVVWVDVEREVRTGELAFALCP